MSLAHNKIIAKLQALDEYLLYLKELQKVNKNAFLKDYHFFGLAEHYLHLSIEVLLDVAKLLIIAFQFPRPEERKDVFRILHEKKIINAKLFDKLTAIGGFRNILIHEYEKVDKNIIYSYLQNNIEQFREFKKAILIFLKKK